MKISTVLATVGLATALSFGAGHAAFAADGSAVKEPTADRIAERCTKVPSVLGRIDTARTRAQERLAKVTAAKATAEADGKTKRAERLGKVVVRVQSRIDELGAAETRVTEWSSEHCDAA